MKNLLQYIIPLMALPLFFAGCNEAEIDIYDQSPRVVFVSNIGDNYSIFAKSHNFTTVYNPTITDNVSIRIQGVALERDLEVFFELNAVDGSDLLGIELLDQPVVISAQSYTGKLYFKVKRPESSTRIHQCELLIDYKTSGLQPGVIERSKFVISASDNFAYEWGADKYIKLSLEDYNTYLAQWFGPPTMIKVRFLLENATLKSYYPNGMADYIYNVGRNLGQTLQNRAKAALYTYNNANPDNPLTDENGNVVSFP